MMSLVMQDAMEAFKDREQQAGLGPPKLKSEAKLQEEMKRRRIEEAMKGVEAQMQKTFLPKIFKGHEDLRKLEDVAIAEERQKRRSDFRAKQLAELEKRKLDCRVRLLSTPIP